MKHLFIFNDPPYGIEKFFNGMRLATALLSVESDEDVAAYLVGDAVVAARKGQKTPNGYYNIERMLKRFVGADGEVLMCGSCMDARAMTDEELVAGARRVTLDEIADITAAADKVYVY